MFYWSIINESKCLNSIKKTKCTTLKAMYISLRLPQINPSSNLYIPQVNHYILLSLSLSTSIGLPPSCGSHCYRYFLSKRMQSFFFFFNPSICNLLQGQAEHFHSNACSVAYVCFPRLCLLCESIKQAKLMMRST